MFDISEIKIEHTHDIESMFSLDLFEYGTWKNNPDFMEYKFQIHNFDNIEFSQLQKFHKLFKPYKMIINLDMPSGFDFEKWYVSMIYQKQNIPDRINLCTRNLKSVDAEYDFKNVCHNTGKSMISEDERDEMK